MSNENSIKKNDTSELNLEAKIHEIIDQLENLYIEFTNQIEAYKSLNNYEIINLEELDHLYSSYNDKVKMLIDKSRIYFIDVIK
jgi:hypothetical protein